MVGEEFTGRNRVRIGDTALPVLPRGSHLFRRRTTGKGSTMSLPAFNMRELIEAGVHFGHKTKRWNPRMAPYIFGVRNDIHIIDLGKTVPLLHTALTAIRDVVAQNGRILFVGTKRQATDPIA